MMALIKRVAEQIGLNIPDDSWQETEGDESSNRPLTVEEEVASSNVPDESAESAPTEPLDSDVILTGPSDETMGMSPARRNKGIPHEAPVQRGRHVGAAALSLVSRVPLVGLKWLRASEEFVIYDDQPPPSGEYVMQTLGISTLEYGGVKQNHLLVTFKAGQLTGFGMEDTYAADEITLAPTVDYLVDVLALLGNRDGRTLVINYNRTISIKVNSTTYDPTTLYSVQSPYIVDLGLNLDKVYITTTKNTKIRFQVW
jgi:hypothetical protein